MADLSVPIKPFPPGELSVTNAWPRSWFEEDRRNGLWAKEDQILLLGEVMGDKDMIEHPDTSTK